MYINFSIIRIAPGRETEFEASIRSSDDRALYATPGWISNSCLRDEDHKGRYFYNSIWESLGDLQSYRKTPEYAEVIKSAADTGLYLGRPDQVRASLILRNQKGVSFP